jgi:hypothetical protein
MSERFRERLRELPTGARLEEPDVDAIRHRGRRLRVVRRLGIAVAVAVLAVGVVLPLGALGGLGQDGSMPGSSATALSPNADDAPDVLRVACTPDGIDLASTLVRPQPDGVHLDIENLYGRPDISFDAYLLGRDDGRFDGWSVGTGPQVFTFPPGPIYAWCDEGSTDLSDRTDVKEFVVVDPDGLWVSDELACENPVEAAGFRYDGSTPSPAEPDPEQAIRQHVPGVLATDEVVPAEYGVRQGHAWMIVRRGGQTLARFQVTEYEHAWDVHFGDTCEGSGIGGG